MEIPCVFCDRTQFNDRLITEDNGWYVVATLGQITNGGYVLVISKEHISCMGALTLGQANSMLQITQKTSHALSLEYQRDVSVTSHSVTVFEHGVVGQTIKHAHLHLLPIMIDLTPKICADFPKAEFEELHDAAHLQELYGKRLEPYLFWTIPNGKSMVCWNPSAPPQYLRFVAAEFLGYPERGNWRNMDPDLDKKLYRETVARLKPYFS